MEEKTSLTDGTSGGKTSVTDKLSGRKTSLTGKLSGRLSREPNYNTRLTREPDDFGGIDR